MRTQTDRRRLRHTSLSDTVYKQRQNVDSDTVILEEEVTAVSGEVKVDGETALSVERLCYVRLQRQRSAPVQ